MSVPVNIEGLKSTVIEMFPQLWLQTEACLATMATLLLKNNANPTALVLVGQSSAGKTTILNMFKNLNELVYFTDSFTPRAFISQYAQKDKSQLEDVDMLKRINQKCFIVCDLGVIFSKRREDLAESLSILTRVLDGDGLSVDGGVHGQRKLTGDYMFAMLGGTIPLEYRVWDTTSRLGSRLVFINMPVFDEYGEDEIIADFIGPVSYKQKVVICGKATESFVSALFKEKGGFRAIDWDDQSIPREVLKAVMVFAKLLVRLRGMIPKAYENQDGNFEHQQLRIESPKRAMSLLFNIAKGRAIIYGRSQVSMEDIPLIREIVLSSGPDDRGKVIKELIRKTDHTLTKTEVSQLLNAGEKVAKQSINNLEALKLVVWGKSNASGLGRPGHTITLSDEILQNIDLLGG